MAKINTLIIMVLFLTTWTYIGDGKILVPDYNNFLDCIESNRGFNSKFDLKMAYARFTCHISTNIDRSEFGIEFNQDWLMWIVGNMNIKEE